ncbi:hypothetical protein SPRG_08140 [Saprolegnia parasitica CBS 223.65]|uniref:Uncharacterized protein n=1 Tax=Saprolegnia parasitica (strain CBS 223.65) TaxID=695850 RepID=A0A067C7V3_SAPPC|nr:hypothetical protein SPRG_08140 [Saprolegnia parasitica CBS 223.65]KDO26849.1 hypothetical protein SPRG_08140 [Saprolegnia parasitica CBS 223.65]|eukprot:XP_012202495.1 hypothetical protein SPRG_08140 [Saprolegnia parasitica CBS 223.65]
MGGTKAATSMSTAYLQVIESLEGTVKMTGKCALTGELSDIGVPKLGVDRSQGHKPSPDLVPVKQPASVITSFGAAPLVVPKEHIYFVQGELAWARYLDGWTRHIVTSVLKPTCRRPVMHLSHMTIDGPGASPVLTPARVPRGTFGTLAIALPSACARRITITGQDDMAWMPLTDMTMSFAAWYNDCSLAVAPITAPGHRAYLVYNLVTSDGEPHRTGPASTSSAASELAALAAQPHQLDTTYAYRLYTKTTDLRFEALQGRDAAFLDALVAAGSFDVALVRASRQQLTSTEMHTPKCNKARQERFRHYDMAPTAPTQLPKEERTPLGYGELTIKVSDVPRDTYDDNGNARDTDASDAEFCSEDERLDAAVEKKRRRFDLRRDLLDEGQLYYTDNAVDKSFLCKSKTTKRRRRDATEKAGDGDELPMALVYDRRDLPHQSDSDCDDDDDDTIAYDGRAYTDDDEYDDIDDGEQDSDAGVDAAYRKAQARGYKYCVCDEIPTRQPWRRITEALVHPTSSIAMQSTLVGRSVGRWVTRRGLKRLRSSLLVFWPKRHRSRLAGIDVAVAALEKDEPSRLGFATTEDVAASLIDAIGAPEVRFIDAHVDSVGAYLLRHPSATLAGRFLPHSFTMRKRASRRRGLRWLQAAIATYGVAPFRRDIVALCAPEHKGFYYMLSLGMTIQWIRRLFVSSAAYTTQDGFVPLLVQCWETLATQLAAIQSHGAYREADQLNPPMLQAALELEAAATAASTASSFPTTMHTFATTLYKTPEAFLLMVVPAVLNATPMTVAAPFLPRLREVVPTLPKELSAFCEIDHLTVRFHARYSDVLAVYKQVAVLDDFNVVRIMLEALRSGASVAATVVREYENLVSVEELVWTVLEALAACHFLSPPHVGRLLDLTTKIVFASPEALYYVRRVLYPVLRYLETTLTMYKEHRDRLATLIQAALQDASNAPDAHSMVTFNVACHCPECTTLLRHLTDQGPYQTLHTLLSAICAKLRAAVKALPPHQCVVLTLLGSATVRLQIWTKVGPKRSASGTSP